jgi:hydroxymethylpyrimidine/phosphomethylpyrimidine kinase
LSAAIATRLARGESLVDAVGRSVDFMERAVRYHHDVGRGPGAVHHLVGLRNDAARDETAERVTDIVEWFVEENVRPLVPEVGMNVVGATPYAEDPGDAAAVEGRITKTIDGIAPNRGVRFGASSHVARFLLGAREYRPGFRFAVNCRFDEDVEAALSSLGWSVAEYDRSEEPDGADATMDWAAREVFETGSRPPVAVVDRGATGKEPVTKLLAGDGRTVAERVVELRDELEAVRNDG